MRTYSHRHASSSAYDMQAKEEVGRGRKRASESVTKMSGRESGR